MKYELYSYYEAIVVKNKSTSHLRITTKEYTLEKSIEILIHEGGFKHVDFDDGLILLCEFDSYEGLLESNPEMFI